MTRRSPWLPTRRLGRARDGDVAAVSSVLGAILVFGLLIVSLIVIQVEFVPVWDKQRERDQGLRVAQQMGTIKADLERIAFNQTGTALSEPISLTREEGFSFFGGVVLPGTARYTPTTAGAGLTLATANPVAIQSSGGQSLYGLSEDWSWTGTAKTSILDIAHLRLRIPNPQGLPSGAGSLVLTASDTSANCVGEVRLVHSGTTATSKAIETQVYPARVPAAATCDPTPIDIRYSFIGTAAATPATHYFYVDVLATPFAAVIASVPATQYPLQVAFVQGNTGGQGAIVYDEATPFGPIRSGGSGVVLPNLSRSLASGTLFVSLNHQRLPAQTYSFEYGAMFLDQPDGSAMVGPPGFSLATSAGQAMLSWAVPTLIGGSSAVTGAPAATVTLVPAASGTALRLAASDITFTLTTPHAPAWANFWRERFALAGLVETPVTPTAPCAVLTAGSPSHFQVTETATTATLVFRGPCTAAGDATRDVQVVLDAGDATVELRAAG